MIFYLYDGMSSEIVAYFSTKERAAAYKAAMVAYNELENAADQYVIVAAGLDPVYVSAESAGSSEPK